jgi:hypothetical protein
MPNPKRTRRKPLSQEQVGKKYGFRSGLEELFAERLTNAGFKYTFEELTLQFTQPAKKRKYTPDFVLDKKDGTKMIIETKGRWVAEDRNKIKLVLSQHPDLDLRIVFSNANARISKKSDTTYADWCDKNNIPWAHKVLPEEWARELAVPLAFKES